LARCIRVGPQCVPTAYLAYGASRRNRGCCLHGFCRRHRWHRHVFRRSDGCGLCSSDLSGLADHLTDVTAPGWFGNTPPAATLAEKIIYLKIIYSLWCVQCAYGSVGLTGWWVYSGAPQSHAVLFEGNLPSADLRTKP
jgi:hypothetical protein